jgi:hypothetical protein
MPVYHVSNFDVSAVQIDLSANIFSSTSLSADYWVKKVVDFNSGGAIKNSTDLNNEFTNIAHTSFGDLGNAQVFRNSTGTRSNDYDAATTSVTNVKFKDLGIIKGLGGGDDSLFTNTIFIDASLNALTTNQIGDETSFVGKVNARLQTIGTTDVTGLAEKMLASINANTNSDLGTNDAVPPGSKFGFLVVRNLNLAGSNQDRQTFIGVVLEQS